MNIDTQYPTRTGLITASRCADLMTRGRGGQEFGETAKTYALELALKRMGYNPDSVSTWQMEWGNEHEPEAREIYENNREIAVMLPGFTVDPTDDQVGCIPDGMVEPEGLLEIKCPQWKAHVDYMLNGPEKRYWQQMQFQMMVTGAQWCDFMTYHPDFPIEIRAKVHRIERDEDYIQLIRDRIEIFKIVVDEIQTKLLTR